jgi:DNA-binding CsgD family transcriptional regulator
MLTMEAPTRKRVHLSPRDEQVVALVLEDLSYKEMAMILLLSERTVEHCVRRIAARIPDTRHTGARAIRRHFQGRV